MTGPDHRSRDGADEPSASRGPDASSEPSLEPLQAAALASVGNAVIITGVDGRIVWVNEAFTEMSGYPADEAIGQTPRILKSGVQDDRHYRDLWARILAGRPWRGEIVDRRKDGALYTVLQTITPIVGTDGAVSHFVAIHEDVTALRASQARLQALFDHALDGFVLFDDEMRLIDANPAVNALTGYAGDALTGLTLRDLVPADYLEGFEQQWATFLTAGQVEGSSPILCKDGATIHIEYEAVRGITPGVNLLIARDVTAQRRAEADQRFQAQLLAAVGEAVVATDLSGIVTYWNPAAERVYGWTAGEALGRPISRLNVPPTALDQADEIMARVGQGESWTGEFEVCRRDGTTFPALVTNAPFRGRSGELAGIIGVSADISDLKATEQLLARRVRQQAAVAELGRSVLDPTDEDPRAVGGHAAAVVADVLGGDVDVELAWSDPAAPGESDDLHEASVVVGDAGVLRVRSRGESQLEHSDHEFLRAVAHVLDAKVQRDAATSQLEHLATHDPLTGLPNRALFLDRLAQARAATERSGASYAVLFLDLDGLKSINDGLGHDAGDEVLCAVADRLRAVVRPADTIARLGGDEFAILCPEIPGRITAVIVAERIQAALARACRVAQTQLAVTASIGIVLGGADSDGGALLRDADTAMYWAKETGPNRIEQFDARMHEQALHRFDMAAALRTALDADGISVVYQPSIELGTGRVVGVEALARLRLPTGQVIPPDEFVPVAEDTGLIAALGERVLARACADAVGWVAVDPAFTVAVNLSPRQLVHPRFTGAVGEILTAAGLQPSSLWLEITETSLLAGPGLAAALAQLRELGVKLAIDDFGTGYSSLAHLRQLPVDMLKIDRAFVDGILTNAQDRALISAAIDLARSFGLATTAEGVETAEQRDELTGLGCAFAQGYLWSPPVAAEAITGLLPSAGVPPGCATSGASG